jgi:uroporphyrin-III C-methyltransferase
MVENDEKPKTSQENHQERTKPSANTTRGNALALFACILSVVAVLIVLYPAFYLKQHNPVNKLNILEKKQDLMQSALFLREEALDKLQKTVAHTEKGLLTLKQRLSYSNEDWMLIQARHYITLAQMHAHWGDNPQTTIALLKQADDLFLHSNNPNLLKIRQTTAQAITQLQAIPPLDLTGMLSQLDAMQNDVDTLTPPLKIQEALEEVQKQTTEKTAPLNWREHLKAAWKNLDKLVIIQRHEQPIQPILSSMDLALLREGLRLDFKKAQLALLRQDENLYKQTLQQARHTITHSFDPKTDHAAAMLQQLSRLEMTPITQKQPSLDTLLSELDQRMKQQEETHFQEKSS